FAWVFNGGDAHEEGVGSVGDGCHSWCNRRGRSGSGGSARRIWLWPWTSFRLGCGRNHRRSVRCVRPLLCLWPGLWLWTGLRLLWSSLLRIWTRVLQRRPLRLLRWTVLSPPPLLASLLVVEKPGSIASGLLFWLRKSGKRSPAPCQRFRARVKTRSMTDAAAASPPGGRFPRSSRNIPRAG